ncbi:MAG: integrase, partial [Paracoccaceae bacterium]|nr:integrase [Paracoccaceae bacterium]
MARLPKYVFRRANGSYRYKRNVPKHLLPLIGKETLYRQLGDTLQEALRTLPRVHAEIEDLFRGEDNTPSSERALRIIKASLGTEIAGWVEAGIVPEYSQEEAELNDLGRSLEGKLPKDIVRQIYSGKLIKEPLTLSKALDEYEAYKLDGSPKDREVISRNAKVKQDLKAALSKVKLEVIPLL